MTPIKARSYGSSPQVRQCARRGTLLGIVQLLYLLYFLLAIPSAQAQTYTVLYQFKGKANASFPYANLMRDDKGRLYGTTMYGGVFDDGTVFEVDAGGKETPLHSFWGGDGVFPDSLIRDKAGNLYGTTGGGGTLEGGGCLHGCGTVFKLNPEWRHTVLYAFSGGADGGAPSGSLIRDRRGDLYGTAGIGGVGSGVVFKLDSNGKETVLYAFKGTPDGEGPVGGLIRDKMGNFYGATEGGGASGQGAVFTLDPAGKETVLYSFTGAADGAQPAGPLAQDETGNLYGTTWEGGDPHCWCGVVFKVDKTGKEVVLHTFTGSPDGSLPVGGIVRDKVGNLYGATKEGGAECSPFGCGAVFEVDHNGNETVLYSFTGGSDGLYPEAGLTIDDSGNLYGTTVEGGDTECSYWGCGVVFKLTP